MAVRITYFVHGTTTDNALGLASGWNDVDLSESGVQQAVELGQAFKDKRFSVVFCSDLRRAVRSAQLAFGGRNAIIEDGRLRECNFGDLNGQPTAAVDSLLPRQLARRFPGGESGRDVLRRIDSFLDMLRLEWDGEDVAVVAHRVPQLALDMRLNGLTWEEALAADWRKSGAWQPGWAYLLAQHNGRPAG